MRSNGGGGGGGGSQGEVRKKFSEDTKAGTRLRNTPDTIVERQIGCMRGKWDWFLSRSPPCAAPAGGSALCLMQSPLQLHGAHVYTRKSSPVAPS